MLAFATACYIFCFSSCGKLSLFTIEICQEKTNLYGRVLVFFSLQTKATFSQLISIVFFFIMGLEA
ncbi:hypothetical protein DB29_01310 [Shouchella clausii]|nr:hypothetical protein DB29_01310 [Shouchella clausii]